MVYNDNNHCLARPVLGQCTPEPVPRPCTISALVNFGMDFLHASALSDRFTRAFSLSLSALPTTEIAGDEVSDFPWEVENMREDQKFYTMLEDDLDLVEDFYLQQLEAAHGRMYELIQHLIQMVRLSAAADDHSQAV